MLHGFIPSMPSRTFALFLRALDNEYQRLQKEEFYARAHLHGASVLEYDAANDPQLQVRQLRECLRLPVSRPKGFFVNPVEESQLKDVAREAVHAGIPWASLNRTSDYVIDLRRQFPSVPAFCVDPDQKQVGMLQAKQVRTLLPAGGELFYICGPSSTSSARLRRAGLEAEMSGLSIRVLYGSGNWSEQSGFQAAHSFLRGSRDRKWATCVIAGQNDSMAFGAHRAVAELAADRKLPEMLQIRVTGCDGAPSYGKRHVADGVLAATVVIPATTGKAIDVVVAALDMARLPFADVALGVTSLPSLDDLAVRIQRERAPKSDRASRR